ncbi:hypothetical protein M231_03830 [Tremella mesenterica]|uniref:Uncharacterized protein n=1 Tax=Tremella mesenterica TaxID=5217 RepID=A0A4Q1BM40_TREME|nr:hypothetical protein M231_03830 [Tremella mesenterica]
MSTPPIVPVHPTSPPIDPSKLNNAPAPLPPIAQTELSQELQANASTASSLRSPDGPEGVHSSAYLDQGEVPSHPTVAETGLPLGQTERGVPKSPVVEADRTGQLPRKEGGEKKTEEIIKLNSFGGEGLAAKPAPGVTGGQ